MYIFYCICDHNFLFVKGIYKNKNMTCNVEFNKLYSEYNNIKIRMKIYIVEFNKLYSEYNNIKIRMKNYI